MTFTKIFFYISVALFFNACGENTNSPVEADIVSIQIDDNVSIVRSTDLLELTATATYSDASTQDVTDYVTWYSSDYSKALVYGASVIPLINGGEVNVSIEYGDFTDSALVKFKALDTTSVFISSADISTTGDHQIEAKGNYINIDTNTTDEFNITIAKNITWDVNNSAVLTRVDDNYTVEILSGTTALTARVFDVNVTKVYTID